jgi:hypothetical protein
MVLTDDPLEAAHTVIKAHETQRRKYERRIQHNRRETDK